MFPIVIGSWYVDRRLGIAASALSALSWYFADVLARLQPYSHALIPAWNAGVRVVTFLAIAFLLTALREALDREASNARVDHLTGAANSRAFYEAANLEIARHRRYRRPFTGLYLDADNLKRLNDSRGHSAGDKALRAAVSALKRTLRPGDVVARIGGDEFAVLLGETDERAAQAVSNRVQNALHEALRSQYQITFSIGGLACVQPPTSADDLLERVDNLMYDAKRNGKDGVALSSYHGAA